MKFFTLFLFSILGIFAKPINKIPADLYDDFTENRSIPVIYRYIDATYESNTPAIWPKSLITKNLYKIEKRLTSYYGETDTWLYQALDEYDIKGKTVAIIGSVTPWYECIVLHYGGKPTTIEYNTIECDDPRIEIFTVDEFNNNPKQFDVILSISSIEHDGLGRYGDPIDPYGDYKAMKKCKTMLNPDGFLILAVPVTEDSITFNCHRTYGRIRLPKLLSGWDVLDSYGFSESDFSLSCKRKYGHQPVFVLYPQV